MNTAIILAAGNSQRFGGEIPKQFLKINGKAIIDYSIDVFNNSKHIDKIIVVVAKQFISNIKLRYPNLDIIEGGNTRKDSSYLGLCKCSKKTKFVLIHDAARMFISNSIITDCIKSLSKNDAVTMAETITDTIAKYQNNNIISMENREELIALQTPQGFKYQLILNAHKKFTGKSTDDIRIMLDNGYKCSFLTGYKNNFKITTKDDYDIASKIIEKQ